jgi:hypothetical protein
MLQGNAHSDLLARLALHQQQGFNMNAPSELQNGDAQVKPAISLAVPPFSSLRIRGKSMHPLAAANPVGASKPAAL